MTETPTKNAKLLAWVDEIARLAKPDRVYWCDGSDEEYNRLCQEMVESGTFIRLNEDKRPNSYLCRSGPGGCGPRGRSHIHMLRKGRGRWAD